MKLARRQRQGNLAMNKTVRENSPAASISTRNDWRFGRQPQRLRKNPPPRKGRDGSPPIVAKCFWEGGRGHAVITHVNFRAAGDAALIP
jgi:hypothetical protein